MPTGVTQEAWDLSLETDKGLYQVSSGQFMWAYLMTIYGILACACSLSILGSIGNMLLAICCK